MGKSDLKTKNDRTSRLLGLLRSEDHWTTQQLALELNISHRTIMRDIEELKEAGYPLEADRGEVEEFASKADGELNASTSLT